MFAHVSHVTYKYVLNVYSEHNNRRGNAMYTYIHAHGVATSWNDFSGGRWRGGARGKYTIESPGKQNARKTGYPVYHNMLFVKTILMWLGISVCIIDRHPATDHFEINSPRRRRRRFRCPI